MGKRKRGNSPVARGSGGRNFRWKQQVLVYGKSREDSALESIRGDELEFLKRAQVASGLSKNKFAEYWNVVFVQKRAFPILPKQEIPGETFSLNMALSIYEKDRDPISVTWDHVTSILEMNPSTLLRELFLDLLRKNSLFVDGRFDPEGVRRVEGWAPYMWKNGRPVIAKRNVGARFLASYAFLQKGKSRHRCRAEIRLTNSNRGIIKQALPIVMQHLHHESRADFFKLLYVSFLRFNGVVNEHGELVENWRRKLKAIDLQNFLTSPIG